MRKNNVRVFFPVGMGGFSFERMDETTVVYDCGAYKSKKVINANVKALKSGFFGVKDRVIDHLFISHFDEDHCNGVDELLKTFEVKEIHLPYIAYKYRAVLNFMTNNGVANLFNTFVQHGLNSRISLYQMNRSTAHTIRSRNGKWEWVITNLLNESYFDKALEMMKGCGIVFNEHPQSEPLEEMVVGGNPIGDVYAETNTQNGKADGNDDGLRIFVTSDKNNQQNQSSLDWIKQSLLSLKLMTASDKLKNANRRVPDIVGDIEKNEGYAKNEYGMLMLSKRRADAETAALFFKNQDLYYWRHFHYDDELTSCFYTGDMCMNKNTDMLTILSLIKYNKEPLQFFQIPHHGSSHNSSLKRLNTIDAGLFFCYDNNCHRLINNLGKVMPWHNPFIYPLRILLIDKCSEMDEVVHIS